MAFLQMCSGETRPGQRKLLLHAGLVPCLPRPSATARLGSSSSRGSASSVRQVGRPCEPSPAALPPAPAVGAGTPTSHVLPPGRAAVEGSHRNSPAPELQV